MITPQQINLYTHLQKNLRAPYAVPTLKEIGFNLKEYYITTKPLMGNALSLTQIFKEWTELNQHLQNLNPQNQFTFKSLIENLPDLDSDEPIIKKAKKYLTSLSKQKLVYQFKFTQAGDMWQEAERLVFKSWSKVGWQIELGNIAQIILEEAHSSQESITQISQSYIDLLKTNNYTPKNNCQLDALLQTSLVYNLLSTRPPFPNQLELLKQILS